MATAYARFATAAGLAVASLLVVGGCGAPSPARGPRPVRPPAVRHTPPPRPTMTPAPQSPRRLGLPVPDGEAPSRRDPTREPLVWAIRPNTPSRQASALRMADRARAELERGTTQHAFELLDTATRIAPRVIPPYVIRAQVHLAEGSTAAAEADIKRAIAMEPSDPWKAEAVAVYGAILETVGNTDGALVAYRRALRIFPSNETGRDALRRLTGR